MSTQDAYLLKTSCVNRNYLLNYIYRCPAPFALNNHHANHNYNSHNPVVSSHLMGLNNLMKRRNKEVSPIQREEMTCLMNSGTSLFDTSQSNQLTNRDLHMSKSRQPQHLMESSDYPKATETRESNDTSSKDMLTLSVDEFSDEKNDIVLSNTSDDDLKQVDEEIEMKRILKMNFYQFKSHNQNGIVGMCQNVKEKRMKSPTNPKLASLGAKGDKIMNDKYKSFLNKSINSCANLMLSNALLSNKNVKHITSSNQKVKSSCENLQLDVQNARNVSSTVDMKPSMHLLNSLQQNL